MKQKLFFDFIVNKENNTIHIIREFNSNLSTVWKAWTTAELLDKWWGPKPWRAETKFMDFNEGGYWLYAMVSPEGERHYSKASFLSIVVEKSFTSKGGFSDENGVINTDFPQNLWENTFIQQDDKVTVDMLLTFDSLSDLEAEIKMGFKEGMTIDLNQLDELLEKLN
ncbi:MAG TPA: SRPBCC domain-containing protein [Saprospiraceae bacterium]|nr:SRPBCC domain-containing protein [Saprospiraceae bacterium]MCB9327795.1 SRPBCC domain-containing protein [Lewinellaceae bacterium]HPK10115.1 SRPBCC domain-containing protein [Saprospiraceae bacterium]HPQ21915.1 SRPBCC domain-containing protein [Saprospiraceae bacterium]HRX27867.1 SRPBCC domain-containing protein [Saprospiraceae bacterium]